MKRIQQLLTLLIICLLCSSLVLTVSAHPGKTDGSGGHTDRSTGDYHYHHGYSAHDHYDMDGDGDIDCPYDFDDKTSSDHSDSAQRIDSSENESDARNSFNWKHFFVDTLPSAIGILALLLLILSQLAALLSPDLAVTMISGAILLGLLDGIYMLLSIMFL